MKLSEAIRAGAKLRPQCFGGLFANGGSCALGAAFEAVFGDSRYIGIFDRLQKEFPMLSDNFGYSIASMNDDLRLTREQIADWVEQQEKKLQREPDESYTKRVLAEIQEGAKELAYG